MWIIYENTFNNETWYGVGYYDPKGELHIYRYYKLQRIAESMCHYLNGGNKV
jgi:hypothetical protein